jgi:hypothetical protein
MNKKDGGCVTSVGGILTKEERCNGGRMVDFHREFDKGWDQSVVRCDGGETEGRLREVGVKKRGEIIGGNSKNQKFHRTFRNVIMPINCFYLQ